MTLVILAAGMGSRYGGMKQIDPIGPNGEFIIDYSCHDAIKAGFDHIVFVIKKENLDIFRSTVGARVEPHVKVDYVFQDINDLPAGFSVPQGRTKPWGTAHALLAARDVVKDNFATINADDFYGPSSYGIIAGFLKNSEPYSLPMQLCMAGFRLSNTLTENGSVSRGICLSDEKGRLLSITERTSIIGDENGIFFEEDGAKTPLRPDAVASMNLFGLTPAIFEFAQAEFVKFLGGLSNPLKGEFYLPFCVTAAMEQKLAEVKLLTTEERWYGVTYAADKPFVQQSIRNLIVSGVYGENLWSDID